MESASGSGKAPRLVLVAADLGAGGAERQMADMANYWVAGGTHVVLVTFCGPAVADFYPLDSRVRRVHLDADSSGGIVSTLRAIVRRITKLRRLLSSEKPDAVLSFIAANNVLTLLAAAGLGLRVVVSERAHPGHDSTVPTLWRALRKVVYSWADLAVAQTAETARWIQQHCHGKVLVIPNALRPLRQMTDEQRGLLIVAVGRLSTQKGFDLLLRAFATLAGKFPEWRAVVIGDGVERERLLQLRADLGLAERVTFPGQTQDVESWMSRAGLVVQPSRFEGFPNVLLEAMGMGAAVISTDCPAGPADLIEDGVNGRLVPVEDVNGLARVMAELMSRPDVRARLGVEASKVRDRFRQDVVMAQWDAALLPNVR